MEEILLSVAINTGLRDIYMIVVSTGSIVLAGILGWLIVKGAQFGKVKNKIVVAVFAAVVGGIVFPGILYGKYRERMSVKTTT